MPIDFRHSERHYLYREEQGAYRRLSLTTKAYAAYLGKLVDPAGGWLELHGEAPAEAFRYQCTGKLTQGDYRMLRRAVGELLEEGYLIRGELVDGEFLPIADGDYVAIRNWIPAQRGMTRKDTQAWHAEREARARRYLGGSMPDSMPVEAESDASSVPLETELGATLDRILTEPGVSLARSGTDVGVSVDRVDTESSASADRAWIEISASAENSNGTQIALIPDHAIPYQSGRERHRAHVPVHARSKTSANSNVRTACERALSSSSLSREAYALADRLKSHIEARLPNYVHTGERRWSATRESWAREFGKMHELDARPWHELSDVLSWSQSDDFWQANILSAGKFRKQYEQLRAQMARSQPKGKPKHSPAVEAMFAELNRRRAAGEMV